MNENYLKIIGLFVLISILFLSVWFTFADFKKACFKTEILKKLEKIQDRVSKLEEKI